MTGPFSRIIDAVAQIATKLGATVPNTGNRLADNLEGIANADIGGGGGGALVVHGTLDDQARFIVTVDKTWAEIYAADDVLVVAEATNGANVFKNRERAVSTYSYEGAYWLSIGYGSQRSDLVTDSPDGYPVLEGT